MKRTAIFLATGAYTGLSPFAPGTAGSLLASVALLFVSNFSHPLFLIGLVFLLFLGIWAASEAERYYRTTDAPQVVIDEIVGMMVSVMFLPSGWMTVWAAFVFFRIFDIIKPFPVRQAESAGELVGKWSGNSPRLFQLAGGVGIMLDDVIAGIYANIATQLLFWVLN